MATQPTSIWTRIWKSIIPLLAKRDENENLLHWLAILVLWEVVLIGGIAAFRFRGQISTSEMLDFYGVISNLVGTIWIAAGVIYVNPGPISNITDLQRHMRETFAYASRHCMVGIIIILLANFAQFGAKLEVVKQLDPKPIESKTCQPPSPDRSSINTQAK